MKMRGGKSYRTKICQGIMQELIGMLARELEKNELAPSKRNYADTIKSYLLEHYREPIEIDRLAKLIHRSPSYLRPLQRGVRSFTDSVYASARAGSVALFASFGHEHRSYRPLFGLL